MELPYTLIERIRKQYFRARNVDTIFREEEYNGALMANRFRYIFLVILAPPIISNTITSLAGASIAGGVINLVALVTYIAATVFHTVIIARRRYRIIRIMSYLTIAADFFLFTLVIIGWGLVVSPENPAYTLKNPTNLYYLLPIVLTVFQFRIRLVIMAISLFLAINSGYLAYSFIHGVPLTADWREYILGPAVIMSDVITTRTAIYTCVAAAMGYAIYRSYIMISRIGHAQAQNASLSRYFSPAVVNEITERPGILEHGRRQQATILFCDIRGFTSMSEGMTPDELGRFLSEFRKRLTMAIFEHGGTIDKYIGDAIMAVFGVPHPSGEPGRDSRSACLAAFAMRDGLAAMNEERQAQGHGPVAVGIGIHAGEVFAGNVGYEDRLEYTVIGDAVNTASRIEGLCKKFDVDFIISRQVYDHVAELVHATRLPLVRVKGKELPLEVFRVDGLLEGTPVES